MNKLLIVLCIIIVCISCTKNNNNTKEPKYLNKDVFFNSVDTIICNGDSGILFSQYLYPVRNNPIEYVAYDLLTNNLLFYNKKTPKNSRVVDIKSTFQMYSSLPNSLFGVIEVKNNKFLVCSEPYFLLIDSTLNILNVFNFNLQENSIKFYRIGDVSNIELNDTKNCIYFPVSPSLPQKNKNAFDKGRIAEINLDKGTCKVLPIKLPYDYEIGKDYKLFSLPNIAIFRNRLFCIYPGSNYLFEYDLYTAKLDSIFISPKHAKISVKEVGTNMEDMVYSYLECDNFYQILSDNNIISLFYWKGKKRKTYNKRKGLDEIDCYIMGYDPDKKEVLFDRPFTLKNVLKKPYMFKEGKLYMVVFNEETKAMNKIQSKIIKYEMVVK